MRRLLPGLVLVLATCAPKDDFVPPIHVQPGAAARAGWIGHGNAPDAGVAAVTPARVHVMKSGEELGGPNAIGRPGDLLLENDEVAFVIDQLGSSAGFAESGGNIVDAADAKLRKDELGQIFTYFGTFPRQGVYEKVSTGTAADGSAWIEAVGHELYATDVSVTTRYTLHGGDRALLLETTVENKGAAPVPNLTLGDAFQWGGAEKFAPERGRDFKGVSSGPFLGGIGRFVSYAITSTEGEIDALSGPSWSDTVQSRELTLTPAQKVQYARVFVVGPRPDVSGLVAELTKTGGGAVGQLSVTLVDDQGHAVVPLAGADVEIATPAGRAIMNVRSAQGGTLTAELPPGSYLLSYAGGGGRGPKGAKVPVTVAANKSVDAKVGVSEAGRLQLACVEIGSDGQKGPTPCKATLEALGAGKNPDFGPGHVAGPAKNQITTDDGRVDVPVAPGRYRVTLSRGPEYALAQLEVAVEPGQIAAPCDADRCLLTRVIDSTGYVAADFHQHTMLGVDAPTGTDDRVVGNVAEGVEIAVASEHNVVADLGPIVRARKLERYLVSIPGDELTTDASRKPWGHANVFPLTYDASKPRGGAPPVRDREAKDTFADLRKTLAVPFVLQINHPRSGNTGYFDQLKFDRKTGVGTGAGYDSAFDAIEVWNGRNVGTRDYVLLDFLALLRTGHPVTAMGNTDTHGIVGQESGYPRTYVRVSDDTHLETWDAARAQDLVRSIRSLRDVLVTNGPFLRVTANGAGIGGIAKAKGGFVDVRVHVECAPWILPEHVVLRRTVGTAKGGDETMDLPLTLALNTKGALAGDVSFHLPVDRDDAFVVQARGTKPLSPVLSGDASEILPYAMSGAIWVDGNGDGKALAR